MRISDWSSDVCSSDLPEFVVLLAENEGGLLGYAMFYDAYEPSYAARGVYMADLYVRPAARRLGLGRRLTAAVADHRRRPGRRSDERRVGNEVVSPGTFWCGTSLIKKT